VERLVMRNALLLDPEAPAPAPGSLLIEGGRIVARLAVSEPIAADARAIDLGGRRLAPGFIDLHFHGALAFCGAEDFAEALDDAGERLLRHGTTAFLATTVAWPGPELAAHVSRLSSLLDGRSARAAVPIGIHLEGPWIHPGAAGAQPGGGIRTFERGEGEEVLERGGGWVRMVTLAPEIEGAPALQAALERRGIAIALGHSLARAEQVQDAVERGARHVTHLFNAMGPLHHRAPGLAGVALGDDRLTCDLICDGVHVDPAMVRVAARAKGERLILITDHIELPGGESPGFGSGPLHDDGTAIRMADGSLAGSHLTLDRALGLVQQFAGLELLEAVAACTLRPARVLGIESERGTLRPGARADFAVLDAAGRVVETWVDGRHAWPE
jgi:N-acetylglucosamine-6-phosphate deacetylase